MTLPIAVDAMGGDFAPGEIVAGAKRAVDELGLAVTLVGVPELLGDPLGLDVVACSEVITMDEDPGASVRKKKDSSLVRAAELVRDGRASALVSAGNTGATMAAALLRMGRLPGVHRPCIATPIPNPGRTPMVLVDAGANAECTPEMLAQFAVMASTYVDGALPRRVAHGRAALDRRRVDQGHAPREGDEPAAERTRLDQLRGQRRGPRPRAERRSTSW